MTTQLPERWRIIIGFSARSMRRATEQRDQRIIVS
jgi:hypothetical protein